MKMTPLDVEAESTLSSSDLYLKICRSTSSNVVTRILHALEENVEKLEINHACLRSHDAIILLKVLKDSKNDISGSCY